MNALGFEGCDNDERTRAAEPPPYSRLLDLSEFNSQRKLPVARPCAPGCGFWRHRLAFMGVISVKGLRFLGRPEPAKAAQPS